MEAGRIKRVIWMKGNRKSEVPFCEVPIKRITVFRAYVRFPLFAGSAPLFLARRVFCCAFLFFCFFVLRAFSKTREKVSK